MRQLAICALVFCSAAPAFAKDYDVSASGRCVYRDNGVVKPIPGAQVELRDQDFDVPVEADVVGPMALDVSTNDVCARGTTDSEGKFKLSGRCGDVGPCLFGKCPKWTPPDLYVRCSLKGRSGRVFRNSFPWTLYNKTTRPRSNSAAPLAAGDIELPAGAAKTFISMNYTYDRIRALVGTWLLDVWTIYPGGHEAKVLNTDQTYFASFAGTLFMSIAPGDEDNGTVAHEYHHTLQFQAFLHDWSRIKYVVNLLRAGYESIRNRSGQGHTLSTVSNPVMAFAEGFAEFGEGVVYGSGLPNCGKWKEIGANEEERQSVEGNVACRLFRLYQRYGYKDIWTALSRSKAVRYDHFMQEYVKLHADAKSVAIPTVSTTVAPLVAAAEPLRAKVALVATADHRIVAPTAKAASYAVQARLSPRLAATLTAAEGPACQATHDTYDLQHRYVTAGCANARDDEAKRECAAKKAELASRRAALAGFCWRVMHRIAKPLELRFVPHEVASPRAFTPLRPVFTVSPQALQPLVR